MPIDFFLRRTRPSRRGSWPRSSISSKSGRAPSISRYAPLAARAGVRVSQISQWKAGSPVTGTTAGNHFRALWRALEEEEHELRKYLKPSRRSRTHRN